MMDENDYAEEHFDLAKAVEHYYGSHEEPDEDCWVCQQLKDDQ